ncbi:Shedu immune nuclease family protein [Singulisphaera sp. GP187]|uniref:Shedu immune nuclease family protein n=1 Tax=Singulisphaera sp. GP187 TaxID=1882752 RepID=UPI001161493C|nr:Shedu immune nuclease family protein [Singulisphaera sp. GP187]
MTDQASEEFWDAIEQIQPNLFRAVALTKLHEIRENAVKTFENQLISGDWNEGDWQTFFEDNTWIFGYGLRYQFLSTVVAQPNYGGTTVTGQGGQRGDFLTASEADLRFTVVVEIKKPGSRLLETQLYRNKVHVLSRDLIGGVTQVQSNCRTWEMQGSQLPENREQLESGEAPSYTIQPKGILIIGNLQELDNYAKRTTFELFRRNVQNPDVITFDELLARSKHLLLNEERSLRPVSDPIGTSEVDFDDEELDF